MKIFNFLTMICDRTCEPLVERVFGWGEVKDQHLNVRPRRGRKLSCYHPCYRHMTPPGS